MSKMKEAFQLEVVPENISKEVLEQDGFVWNEYNQYYIFEQSNDTLDLEVTVTEDNQFFSTFYKNNEEVSFKSFEFTKEDFAEVYERVLAYIRKQKRVLSV